MSLRRCLRAWIAAAALVLPLALVGPATPARAVLPECSYYAFFLGMHGMGEGPSTTHPNVSVTIAETRDVFLRDMEEKYHKVAYGGVLAYPSVSFVDWSQGPPILAALAAEKAGEDVLKDAIDNQTCADPKFVLAGYSMGAWVVGNFLVNNPSYVPRIKAVMLYGDPNRYRYPEGKTKGKTYYQGLVQWWNARPTKDYPVSPDRTLSICLDKDPLCGEGYPNTVGSSRHDITKGSQTRDSALCVTTKCEHLKYIRDKPDTKEQDGYGLTDLGGRFLAEFAVTGRWSG